LFEAPASSNLFSGAVYKLAYFFYYPRKLYRNVIAQVILPC